MKALRKLVIIIMDSLVVLFSSGIALLFRFDLNIDAIPMEYMSIFKTFLPLQILLTIFLLTILRMYRFVWRMVGLKDVLRMFICASVAVVLSRVGLIPFGYHMPLSVEVNALILQVPLLVGMRCSLRIYREARSYFRYRRGANQKRIMLIGGGDGGRAILQEMTTAKDSAGKICCIIDDNSAKKGEYLGGVRIVGGREKIAEYVQKMEINEIILAIPSISGQQKRELLQICNLTGVTTKILPSIMQMVDGPIHIKDAHEVRIEDLLGRDEIRLDLTALSTFLADQTVLVTGGGGSIGSELCRQIAAYRPKKLIILDIYENNAYDIQQELVRKYGKKLDLQVEIASVRDKEKIEELFCRYRPDLVFHAAAHKHVPLMEDCPSEAIKNNIFGTLNVVNAAEQVGVKKFIMISTDKAVNPTNIMGTTKRFCEMILQSRYNSKTEFCAVRFGNVLGSNGSVVPLFKKQIAAGGPVTVTDKRITRYFMTIPEAVQLVLEAGSMAKPRQIFVLDMGEPVKIIDLAENLVRLSGYVPYKEMPIEEVGLRPGEKLYEELLMSNNALSATCNRRIFVEQQTEISRNVMAEMLEQLWQAVESYEDTEQYKKLLKELVPTYHEPQELNQRQPECVTERVTCS